LDFVVEEQSAIMLHLSASVVIGSFQYFVEQFTVSSKQAQLATKPWDAVRLYASENKLLCLMTCLMLCLTNINLP
jgi:hypothetical protein